MNGNVLQIGDVSAAQGTKASGFLHVPGTGVRMPLTIVNGAKPGETLLITGGIHGGEYPCIEAAIRFGVELNPAELSGRVIIMSPVSLNSFHARQAFFVPEDGKNLNRQFPGKALGTVSERMAYIIMSEVVPHISDWVDLHGGDIPEALVPFMGYESASDPQVNERSLGMAEVFGIKYLVKPDRLAGTTISAAAALGIPALLAEAGQLGVFDEGSTQTLLQGCRNVAQYLGILPGKPAKTTLHIFTDWPWVRSAHGGCWYPSVRLGDTVQQGQQVGVIKDYFGNVLSEYTAPASGIVLLLWSALAVNPENPLIGIAVG